MSGVNKSILMPLLRTRLSGKPVYIFYVQHLDDLTTILEALELNHIRFGLCRHSLASRSTIPDKYAHNSVTGQIIHLSHHIPSFKG